MRTFGGGKKNQIFLLRAELVVVTIEISVYSNIIE